MLSPQPRGGQAPHTLEGTSRRITYGGMWVNLSHINGVQLFIYQVLIARTVIGLIIGLISIKSKVIEETYSDNPQLGT